MIARASQHAAKLEQRAQTLRTVVRREGKPVTYAALARAARAELYFLTELGREQVIAHVLELEGIARRPEVPGPDPDDLPGEGTDPWYQIEQRLGGVVAPPAASVVVVEAVPAERSPRPVAEAPPDAPVPAPPPAHRSFADVVRDYTGLTATLAEVDAREPGA